MSQSMSSCSCRRLEARTEDVLPQFDCLALGRLVVGSGDRVERLLGRCDEQVAVPRLVALGHIVVEIDRVEDLDWRAPPGRQLGRWTEVGKSDLAVEAAVDNEGKELLECLGIVVESQSAIDQMDPHQFKHEALALEISIAPSLASPPLCEPDELREVRGVRLLTTADEIEVLAHTWIRPKEMARR